ncbi:MAG: hypothetical protein OXU45_08830 [Candidatus Melainabacteria bacterium]|nr:hypothetical protein [Candidatus Melainabacteria bacterium]
MNEKFETIGQGLDRIQVIDAEISELLEAQEYGKIVEMMPKRMSVICQMTQIREADGITEEEQKRLDKIFSGAHSIQQKITEKKDNISGRLKKHKTIKSQNKRLRY